MSHRRCRGRAWCPDLYRVDVALVPRPHGPLMLHDPRLGDAGGVVREEGDGGIVLRPRVAHEVEGGGMCELVDGVHEDDPGGAACARPRQRDGEAADNERFVEALKVGVVRLAGDWFERRAHRCEDSGDVGEARHLGGGEEARRGCLSLGITNKIVTM